MIARLIPSLLMVLLVGAFSVSAQSLDGESISTDTSVNDSFEVTARCRSDGTGRVTYSVACSVSDGSCYRMEGPYVGTFSQSGTVVIGKPDKNDIVVKSSGVSFAITSPQGNVTGSSSKIRQGTGHRDSNFCQLYTGQDEGGEFNIHGVKVITFVQYLYKAKTPGGPDTGIASAIFRFFDYTWEDADGVPHIAQSASLDVSFFAGSE
jgi:hypothetical protein